MQGNPEVLDYLNQLPIRAKLRQRLTQLWNYERFGLPVKRAADCAKRVNAAEIFMVVSSMDGGDGRGITSSARAASSSRALAG